MDLSTKATATLGADGRALYRTPPDGKLAYRVPEACAALGIGRTSLYELVKDGKLRLAKVAGRTLVPRSELEKLLAASMLEAA